MAEQAAWRKWALDAHLDVLVVFSARFADGAFRPLAQPLQSKLTVLEGRQRGVRRGRGMPGASCRSPFRLVACRSSDASDGRWVQGERARRPRRKALRRGQCGKDQGLLLGDDGALPRASARSASSVSGRLANRLPGCSAAAVPRHASATWLRLSAGAGPGLRRDHSGSRLISSDPAALGE